MLLVQKWPFFQLFFLRNIGQEIVFYDILETKITFVGFKKNKFQKVKKFTFLQNPISAKPMVLVQKWPFLQVFYLRNIGQEIVFYDIVDTKNAFLGYKKNKFKKVEKLLFFQRG